MGGLGKALETAKGAFEKAAEGMGVNFSENIEHYLGESALMFVGFAAGAVAAIGGVTAAITAMAVAGSSKSDIEETFEHLTAGAGLAADTLLGKLHTATAGTIGDLELMKTVNLGLASGMKLTAEQYELVGAASRALSKTTGIDETEAFEKVNRALMTGQDRLLKRIGVVSDAKGAEEDYKLRMEATGQAITDTGLAEVKREAILTALGAQMGRIGEQHVTFGEKVTAAKVMFENFTEKVEIGIARSPVLAELLDGIGKAFSSAFGNNQQSLVESIIRGVNQFAIALTYVADSALQAAKYVNGGWELIKTGIYTVEEGVVGLGYALVHLVAIAADLAAKVPGVGSAFKGLNSIVQDTDTYFKGMHDSLQQQAEDAAQGVVGTDKLGNSLSGWQEKIGDVRNKMIEANSAMDAHAAHLETVDKDANNAATSHVKLTTAVKDYIAAWKELKTVGDDVAATVNAIDGALVSEVQYWLNAGASIATVAKAYSDQLTPAQIDAIDKMMKGTEKYAQAWDKAQGEVDKLWTQAVETQKELGQRGLALELAKLNTQQAAEITAARNSIAAEDQLQSALMAIDAKYDALRKNAKVKNEQDVTKQTKQIWDQTYQILDQASMNSTDYEIAQIRRWLAEKIADAKLAGIEDQKYYDALYALADVKMQDVVKRHSQSFKDIKTLLTDLQSGPGGFVDTFSQTLAHTGSFAQAFEDVWGQVKKDVENIFGSLLSSIIGGFLQPLLDNVRSAASSISSMLLKALGVTSGGAGGAGGGILGDAISWATGGMSAASASGLSATMASITASEAAGAAGASAAGMGVGFGGSAAGAGGSTGAAAGGFGSSLGSVATFLATNPIGWAIDGAIAATLIWNHFSGPDSKELEGRDALKQWESDVWGALSPAQKKEAQGAGFSNSQDAGALIWMRTAFQNMGRPDPEKSAEAYMHNVWDSVTKGHTGVVSAIGDVTSFASEGFASGPTLAMIGDAAGEKGEYVLHESTVRGLSKAAMNGMTGSGREQTIIVQLDRRTIAHASVRGTPDVLRVHGIRG